MLKIKSTSGFQAVAQNFKKALFGTKFPFTSPLCEKIPFWGGPSEIFETNVPIVLRRLVIFNNMLPIFTVIYASTSNLKNPY